MTDLADVQLLQEQLQGLSETVPPLLRRHPLTKELADDFVRSLTVSESPFTLAVAGQMRVGKSTLINALIGADLAIPGVWETTATVNWIRHGTPEQAHHFRVVWDDLPGTTELLPLTEKSRWLGSSEMATRTRYLEFFGTAEFLKQVHVADIPGTRSTIASHQQVAREFFLSVGKAERDSLFYGGIADCIAYVLPSVIRQNDADMLGEFAANTRFPQSTPYNSVGLLHKWETLEHPTPWLIGARQAHKAFQTLKPYVSAVLPVSGPLGRASQICSPAFWELALQFARGTTTAAWENLTIGSDDWLADEAGCSVNSEQRAQMQAMCPIAWPCFKTLLLFARSRDFADGQELRAAVREISGIDQVLDFLQRRFFERSRMIRFATILGRALRVGDLARGRIRNQLGKLSLDQAAAQRALAELGTTTEYPNTRAFVERQLHLSRTEQQELTTMLRGLETQTSAVRETFELFERDCQSVQILDDHADEFSPEEAVEILRLLGAYGSTLTERLGTATGDPQDLLHERLDFWLIARSTATGNRRQVIDQAVARIENLLRQ